MADMTTIWVAQETKAALDALKVHPRETYDDVLRRILEVGKPAEERRAG